MSLNALAVAAPKSTRGALSHLVADEFGPDDDGRDLLSAAPQRPGVRDLRRRLPELSLPVARPETQEAVFTNVNPPKPYGPTYRV